MRSCWFSHHQHAWELRSCNNLRVVMGSLRFRSVSFPHKARRYRVSDFILNYIIYSRLYILWHYEHKYAHVAINSSAIYRKRFHRLFDISNVVYAHLLYMHACQYFSNSVCRAVVYSVRITAYADRYPALCTCIYISANEVKCLAGESYISNQKEIQTT